MAEKKAKTTKCRITKRGVYAPVKKGQKTEELEVGKSYPLTDSQMITHVNKFVLHGEEDPSDNVNEIKVKDLEAENADLKKQLAEAKKPKTPAAPAAPKTPPGK